MSLLLGLPASMIAGVATTVIPKLIKIWADHRTAKTAERIASTVTQTALAMSESGASKKAIDESAKSIMTTSMPQEAGGAVPSGNKYIDIANALIRPVIFGALGIALIAVIGVQTYMIVTGALSAGSAQASLAMISDQLSGTWYSDVLLGFAAVYIGMRQGSKML